MAARTLEGSAAGGGNRRRPECPNPNGSGPPTSRRPSSLEPPWATNCVEATSWIYLPVVVDALNALDLLRPRRSTVSINAAAPPPRAAGASAAELSTEDVRRDIEDLGWRACPVGSVISIHAGASPVPLAAIPPGSAAVQRASPPSVLGATSLLPPPAAPGVAGKRKRAPRGQEKGRRLCRPLSSAESVFVCHPLISVVD